MAVPPDVATVIFPDELCVGTLATIDDAVALLIFVVMLPKLTVSPVIDGLNPVPVIVTAPLTAAAAGENCVIAGTVPAATTLKAVGATAEPWLFVTDTVPEVAPEGTVAWRPVALATVTVADVPLN